MRFEVQGVGDIDVSLQGRDAMLTEDKFEHFELRRILQSTQSSVLTESATVLMLLKLCNYFNI
jgi:hypothetical protein